MERWAIKAETVLVRKIGTIGWLARFLHLGLMTPLIDLMKKRAKMSENEMEPNSSRVAYAFVDRFLAEIERY